MAPLMWIVGGACWFGFGVAVMATLDISSGYALSREVRAWLKLGPMSTILLMVVLWPLGVLHAIWAVFRAQKP